MSHTDIQTAFSRPVLRESVYFPGRTENDPVVKIASKVIELTHKASRSDYIFCLAEWYRQDELFRESRSRQTSISIDTLAKNSGITKITFRNRLQLLRNSWMPIDPIKWDEEHSDGEGSYTDDPDNPFLFTVIKLGKDSEDIELSESKADLLILDFLIRGYWEGKVSGNIKSLVSQRLPGVVPAFTELNTWMFIGKIAEKYRMKSKEARTAWERLKRDKKLKIYRFWLVSYTGPNAEKMPDFIHKVIDDEINRRNEQTAKLRDEALERKRKRNIEGKRKKKIKSKKIISYKKTLHVPEKEAEKHTDNIDTVIPDSASSKPLPILSGRKIKRPTFVGDREFFGLDEDIKVELLKAARISWEELLPIILKNRLRGRNRDKNLGVRLFVQFKEMMPIPVSNYTAAQLWMIVNKEAAELAGEIGESDDL